MPSELAMCATNATPPPLLAGAVSSVSSASERSARVATPATLSFVVMSEERYGNCSQCHRLVPGIRWTGTGWVRRTPGASGDRGASSPHRPGQ